MSENQILSTLKNWSDQGLIRAVDHQFAKLFSGIQDDALPDSHILLAALVSHELAAGNVCLPVRFLLDPAGHWPAEMLPVIEEYDWSDIQLYPELLGNGEQPTPLILDQQRLYLYRYWQYEVEVAEQVQLRAQRTDIDGAELQQSLDELFPALTDSTETDWQKVAAAIAVQKRFAVISGGPGTGKTTTVIKLLALYLRQKLAQGQKAQIKLAAPTGKAAARLSESISSAKERLNLDEDLVSLIPGEATTLHRLLGVIPNSIQFRHDRSNPLHLDMLVLDEASMVDLPMMARLLAALPENACLVLLGDRDQLASVEAGSVLGDICSWPGELLYSDQQTQALVNLGCLPAESNNSGIQTGIADCLSLLRKSYRFDEHSGIGFLARAVNAGDSRNFLEIVNQGFSDLNVMPLNRESYEQMLQRAVSFYTQLSRKIRDGLAIDAVLSELTNFQLLCALREGPYGVGGLNKRIREGLQSRGLVPEEGNWYTGRPVMISQNDAALNLFNGDIGITLPDESGRLKVWFQQNGELCSYLPSRLPEHETVYAMTIHKSQGSEFTQVVLLLPADDLPVLSRELLYTAITRARKSLEIYAPNQLIKLAIERKTERSGGLVERLWDSQK